MRTSYDIDDVILLLKDVTGLVKPQPAKERERLIQSGRHYCEMLPVEYVPTSEYMDMYKKALEQYAAPTAAAIGKLADKIIHFKGADPVLISIARAGIPVGILLKRFIKAKYNLDLKHYSISIIRGRGIDDNALKYILRRHAPEKLLFVDGWIGKGAILNELKKDLDNEAYTGISPDIAVVSDPAYVTRLCGTHEDILIPSSCLNCTVSGLISRTFLRDDIIKCDDFHGAVYYGELKDNDLSYGFIEEVEKHFDISVTDNILQDSDDTIPGLNCGMNEVLEIAHHFNIPDINFIKPGIGETTRVLLRRIPWKILVDPSYKDDMTLRHIIRLAHEKNTRVQFYSLKNYKCCGIIKKLADI